MRILSITAGAAGMYCGSCARDNALARALIAAGHDVTLVPVYTPTRTDEPNVSEERVLFGGISVYLEQYVPLFRKMPRILDRIWDSPRVISAFAGRAVSNDPKMLGDLTLSMLDGRRGPLRKEFLKLTEWLRHEPAPEVVNIPNSLLISLAAPLREALGVPVCCTLQGEELFIDGLAEPYREQALTRIRSMVPDVDLFIAVSEYCRDFMAGYLEIPEDRIRVVPLGINLDGCRARPPRERNAPFRLGYFARIAPEKGLHLLADAFVRLCESVDGEPVELHIAGYTAPPYEAYLASVGERLATAGLADRFHNHGVVDREGKLSFLQSLDALSVPATYDEPKGMFLLEAMANGVPVVQPRRGAFIEIVEATGGGVLVPPDDPELLAREIRTLVRDTVAAETLGRRAFEGAHALYGVERSAGRLLEVYGEVAAARRPSIVGAET
jgi:glycosyltransferase involved in cell wall biosynthesis